MCGIVGHAASAGVPNSGAVRSGVAALAHRGPDNHGLVTLENACLGHTRLSIIDLAGSPQPWQSPDGRYTLVFNGEIYNFKELRKLLKQQGLQFRSQGDTEVLLAAYIYFGLDCLAKLNGMFAFAIWDNVEKLLFLARDRVGKKPLYYAHFGEQLAFASELSALQGFRTIDWSIDPEAVQDFFSHQFIGGPRSIYRGVRKLLPGHYLIYQKGAIRQERYWAPPYPEYSKISLARRCEELLALVQDAVQLRLQSDVPLGAFLSGGIDSSLVVAMMKRNGADVQTFTVGFTEATFDESAHAATAAKLLGVKHYAQQLAMNFSTTLRQCLTAFGEPFADPSAIPVWHLCRHARNYVTVALSGDGVDELFAGYRRYYARRLAERLRLLPRSIRTNLIPRLVNLLPESESYYAFDPAKQLKLFAQLLKRLEESPEDPTSQVFSLQERRRLLNSEEGTVSTFPFIDQFGLADLDYLSQMLLADLQTYLPEDILTKVDRMSMQHGLEVRSPFLDYRVVEFACRLPAGWKLYRSEQKYLLKRCFSKDLPEFILKRKKHGFAVPLGKWLRASLKPLFQALVLDGPLPDSLNKKEILRLWLEHLNTPVDHGFKLWALLVFCHWHQNRVAL